ncbi:MAG: helix-turn-helix domain-containing protein [Candidatus Micrarchaeota archaeon]
MDARSVLEKTGLSEKEARTYISLLELGEASGGEVAQRCGFHRRTAYDVLENLLKKGLASYSVKKFTRVYRAADPKTLIMRLEERKELLQAVLPALEKLVETEEGPLVNVYVGKEGLKTILNDHLSLRQTLYIYAGAMQIVETLDSFHKRYTAERKRLGIKNRGIMVDTPYVRRVLSQMPLFEYKFLPPHVSSPVIWWVYADRVVFIYWREEPFAIQVQSKSFATSFKQYFDYAWKEETATYRGLDGMRAIMEDTLNYPETLFIGAGGQAVEHYPEYFWKDYLPRAKAMNHKWKGIAWPEVRHKAVMKAPITNFRFFSKGVRNPNVVWIYGDKVVNVLWGGKKTVAFVVENKEVSRAYRKYFKQLWQQARE